MILFWHMQVQVYTLLSCSPPRPSLCQDTRTSYSNFKEMLIFPRLPSG